MCFKKRKKDLQSTLIKFAGRNEDLVWTSPEISGLYEGKKIDVVVPFTHEAICVIDGVAEKVWSSGRYSLETDKKYSEQDICFYFINKTVVIPMNWGTPTQIDVIDPIFEMPVRFGANGELKLSVADSKVFMQKIVGTTKGIVASDVAVFFRNKIALLFNTHLASLMSKYKLSYFELPERLQAMSVFLKESLENEFLSYGLQLDDFIVNGINIAQDTLQKFTQDQEMVRRLKVRGEIYEKLKKDVHDEKESEVDRQIRIIKALGESAEKSKDDITVNITNKSLL
ncbi:MAG: SPFH domain-containing protein [Christensenellales bacterium]